MDLVSHVTLLGGACSRGALVERCGQRALDQALARGSLVRVARGRYALSSTGEAVRRAAALSGVLSLRSAAQRHGWGQRLVPERPDVTFPRNRRVARSLRSLIVPHWVDLDPADVDGVATSKRRTLIDCMRMLPVIESLPILDSALRAGDVSSQGLLALAHEIRGRGRQRAIGVARAASARTANPFESTLRAIAISVAGLSVQPQYPIRVSEELTLHPDLADPSLGIVVEAESFEWHGKTAALTRDCRRYNAFSLKGWAVYRFSWWLVIRDPAYVHDVLREAVRAAEHAIVARGSPALLA